MSPHGFTKEHNQPRSHTFMLLDQFVVDRAFGGRFTTKNGWRYLADSGDFKLQDALVDLYPTIRPQAVQARHGRGGEPGLPVVQDAGSHPRLGLHGDPVPNAKWSARPRSSNWVGRSTTR